MKKIDSSAFGGCTALKTIYMNAVTPPTLADNAFTNFDVTLYVPEESINAYTASNTWNKFNIRKFPSDMLKYEIVYGGGPNGEDAAKVVGLTAEGISNLVIPKTTNIYGYPMPIIEIGAAAFAGNKDLKSVVVCNGIISIGKDAFAGCSSLSFINLPQSIVNIDNGAFYNCTSLTSITIPKSVTKIGAQLFQNCSGLISVDIPEGVIEIGQVAFNNCSSLTSITIPESVTEIGSGIFFGCSALTSVTIPESVTTIGFAAFQYCSALTSVTIPNSVTTIGNSAFAFCSALTEMNIPDAVTEIGNNAFVGCSALTSVSIGESVKTIIGYAFYLCPQLFNVTCNATTPPEIDPYSFSIYQDAVLRVPAESVNSYRQADVWKLFGVIEGTDTELSEIVEVEDSGFKFIIISENECMVSGTTIESEDMIIPSGIQYNGTEYKVVSIRPNSFSGMETLKSIKIPETVTRIGFGAFMGCSELTSIEIPNSVVSIEENTFRDCKSLLTIHLPSSIIEIAREIFSGCSALTSVTIPNSVTTIGYNAFAFCSKLTSVTIPNSVTTIGNEAFYQSALTSVTIPNSVTTIGYSAFTFCTKLTSVTIPNSVTTIGYGTFYGCSALTSVSIPEVDSIGRYTFWNCKKLEKVYVKSLESWMNIWFENEYSNPLYYGAELIVNGKKTDVIEVPDDTEEVNEFAFAGSKNIVEAVIPQSVKSVGDNAFQGCTSLKSVKIGRIIDKASRADNTTLIPNCEIGANTFSGCESLDFVAIGTNVSSIGERAFGGCGKLTRVDCYALVAPTVNANSFDEKTMKDATLHVPTGYKAVYEADAVWSRFGTIIDDLAVAEDAKPSGIEGVDDDGVPAVRVEGGEIVIDGDGVTVEVYSLTGARVAVTSGGRVSGLPRGIYLVRTGGKTYKVAL